MTHPRFFLLYRVMSKPKANGRKCQHAAGLCDEEYEMLVMFSVNYRGPL